MEISREFLKGLMANVSEVNEVLRIYGASAKTGLESVQVNGEALLRLERLLKDATKDIQRVTLSAKNRWYSEPMSCETDGGKRHEEMKDHNDFSCGICGRLLVNNILSVPIDNDMDPGIVKLYRDGFMVRGRIFRPRIGSTELHVVFDFKE